ncbi:MAG: Hsp70 family protein [Planctomycetaceae bacterium]
MIIKKMKLEAEKTIGPIANAVVTIPYYFDSARRIATRNACAMAGLNLIDIVNDCSASALAYSWKMAGEGSIHHFNSRLDDCSQRYEKTILLYDLGGCSFNVALAKCTLHGVEMLAMDGDVMLGGIDWSRRRLSDHLVDQFKQKFGVNPSEDPETMWTFHQEAEDAKRELEPSYKCRSSVYHKGNTLSLSLTRTELNT